VPAPKDPIKREGWLRKIRDNVRNPEWIYKHKEGIKKRSLNPTWRSNLITGAQKRIQNPEWQLKMKLSGQKCIHNPEWLRKNKELREKMYQDPEWQHKQKEGARKKAQDPEWQYNHTKSMQKLTNNPEWIRKNREVNQRKAQDPEWLRKNKEGSVGGFWCGSVRYDNPKYCELWCPDLWRRIDGAQNYQSILSGKTKEDNICRDGKTRALSRHQVYWQPRACCVWDEDVGGYYAWIETGTKKHPNKVKYYIKGDPNKFVLLTANEHKMISKDKLKWIKVFEDLIETKLGGVCYLPKVEE
jgi:hypothetical protein